MRMTTPAAGSATHKRTPARAASPRGVPAPSSAQDQAQIVGRHVHKIALPDVRPAAQPTPAQAAAVEGVLEAALDPLGPQAEGLLGDPRAQPRPIAVDRAPGVRVAV